MSNYQTQNFFLDHVHVKLCVIQKTNQYKP